MLNSFITGLKHIKTTIGGIAAIAGGIGLLAPELFKLANGEAPDMVAVKTAWVAICGGVALIFAKDADKSNAPSPTAQATATPTPPKGFSLFGMLPVLAALAILGAWAFAPSRARADDAPPLPTGLRFCFTDSCTYHLQTGLGFGGTFYTKTDQGVQIARNVQLAGLAEIGVPLPVNPVIGPAWQTGTAQGWGATAGIVEKSSGVNGTLLASGLYVGGKVAWAFGLGTLTRF